MQFHERIKALREDHDLKQTIVAAAIGTTRQQMYKYENGLQDMTATRLKAMCLYYGVSADYILGLPKNLKWPR